MSANGSSFAIAEAALCSSRPSAGPRSAVADGTEGSSSERSEARGTVPEAASNRAHALMVRHGKQRAGTNRCRGVHAQMTRGRRKGRRQVFRLRAPYASLPAAPLCGVGSGSRRRGMPGGQSARRPVTAARPRWILTTFPIKPAGPRGPGRAPQPRRSIAGTRRGAKAKGRARSIGLAVH